VSESHIENLSYLYVNGSEGYYDDRFLMSKIHVSCYSLPLYRLITYFMLNFSLNEIIPSLLLH